MHINNPDEESRAFCEPVLPENSYHTIMLRTVRNDDVGHQPLGTVLPFPSLVAASVAIQDYPFPAIVAFLSSITVLQCRTLVLNSIWKHYGYPDNPHR